MIPTKKNVVEREIKEKFKKLYSKEIGKFFSELFKKALTLIDVI